MYVEQIDLQCTKSNSSLSLMNAVYGRRTTGILGYSHLTGESAGGQAEHVRVPRDAVNLLRVPEVTPYEKTLHLSDVVGTSGYNVWDTGDREGDSVAVWVSHQVPQPVISELKQAYRVAAMVRTNCNWPVRREMGAVVRCEVCHWYRQRALSAGLHCGED